MKREQAAIAVSAPLMLGGLVAAALADTWPVRLGGAAMVIGASVALAVTGRRARQLSWGLAALGAVAVLASCI
ncbi:hypothetical protein DJ017_12100 [Phenylobacterium soli]|uniref:Uncharacterized protein n=2 Tax=Phenylobacterium soli TaxID=2170551 RepID=A0A328AQL4_9CAUL|nr:hypothetical protein DJ017_12100 [Phenylobacterium soli]